MVYNQPVERFQRLISGKGIIQLPKDPLIRICYINAFVARFPKSDYRNYKYNSPRSVYANLVFFKDGYVVREETMHYEQQRFEIIEDITGQSMYAINCGFAAVQRSIGALATALGFTIGFTPGVAYYPLDIYPDTIKVVCRDDTAVAFALFTQQYDVCDDVPPPPPLPNPSEPPPTGAVPPGTPLNGADGSTPVSPAYDGEDDGGDTIPYPGDELEPPEPSEFPAGSQCQLVTVSGAISGDTPDGQTITRSFSRDVWGVAEGYDVIQGNGGVTSGDVGRVEVLARGAVSAGGCGVPQSVVVASVVSNVWVVGSVEIVEIRSET